MITIIDYGMGNLRSVQKAVEKVGGQVQVSQNALDIANADKCILPGVGAFSPAINKLHELNLVDPIKQSVFDGKLFLGICLGFQLIFDKSFEDGEFEGLGLLPGAVNRFAQGIVPHMGWNQLQIQQKDSAMYSGVVEGSDVYFCHSYYVDTDQKDEIATTTEYGVNFVSSVCKGNIWGTQFHPEKSQSVGLKILENFVKAKI